MYIKRKPSCDASEPNRTVQSGQRKTYSAFGRGLDFEWGGLNIELLRKMPKNFPPLIIEIILS